MPKPAHTPSWDRASWERLGQLLQQRRAEISPRYINLTLFVAEREINYRLAWDIENGAERNYRPATLRSVEIAYGLAPGDIGRILAGKQPAARTAAQSRPPGLDGLPPGLAKVVEAAGPGFAEAVEQLGPDPLRVIRDMADMDETTRQAFIALAEAMAARARQEAADAGQAAQHRSRNGEPSRAG